MKYVAWDILAGRLEMNEKTSSLNRACTPRITAHPKLMPLVRVTEFSQITLDYEMWKERFLRRHGWPR